MVAVLEFKVEAPPQSQVQASTGPTEEKKEKKKKDDALNKPPAPSALPISDKPVRSVLTRWSWKQVDRFLVGAKGSCADIPCDFRGQDDANVGNNLLKMMGWKEGFGLGTDGEGRVDLIQTNIYTQGVGLGVSKGRELGKYADGYTGYVRMAQDAVRERFGS
ncbi:hypothetical protein M405DRAFT_869717 [Rhizopogon salebrosus TDB-379]|nr:hypothetical protein M405DRAFT_869717 [Rhizopogon salebrosus TDB-379]